MAGLPARQAWFFCNSGCWQFEVKAEPSNVCGQSECESRHEREWMC